MSHPQQLAFIRSVKDQFPSNFTDVKVLEVGSLDINGSIRQFFNNCEYLGIDVGPGRHVDIVCAGQDLDHADETYDTVASCECFEHNPEWVKTFINMHRLAKSGGLVFVTCATTGRPEHGTTKTSPNDSPLTVGLGWDYYKNLTEHDFKTEFMLDEMFSSWNIRTDLSHRDLYFYGVKK